MLLILLIGKMFVILLQNAHKDSHYVAAFYKYEKQMVVKYCQFSMIVYLMTKPIFQLVSASLARKQARKQASVAPSKVGHC